MAVYSGPRCRLSRAEGTDLGLLSGVTPIDKKCKLDTPPGQHGAKRPRKSDYALQLRAKQMLRRVYGVLERQFRRYYAMASRLKGPTGELLLRVLESRLDNVVYRMGFASTRAEARQIVGHKSILVNGQVCNIASRQVKPGDVVEVREKSRAQSRIKLAIELSEQRVPSEWLDVKADEFKGEFKRYPDRSELPAEYKEQLVVELYSK